MTFHAFCERVLSENALAIGLPDSFGLADDSKQWRLVHDNFEKFKLDYYKPVGNPYKFVDALLSHFSKCKDELVSPDDYLRYAEHLKLELGKGGVEFDEYERVLEVAESYATYENLLREKDLLDFGDLITQTYKLFSKRPSILSFYQKKFKYILVDEFQDTNVAQYELVKLLAGPTSNLTVVGDDDQRHVFDTEQRHLIRALD
jgi:DNA helicase-2/ATP-dependent DNA helicase PcrA